jgi:hypothetical protein
MRKRAGAVKATVVSTNIIISLISWQPATKAASIGATCVGGGRRGLLRRLSQMSAVVRSKKAAGTRIHCSAIELRQPGRFFAYLAVRVKRGGDQLCPKCGGELARRFPQVSIAHDWVAWGFSEFSGTDHCVYVRKWIVELAFRCKILCAPLSTSVSLLLIIRACSKMIAKRYCFMPVS